VSGLLGAVQFLTRVPVRTRVRVDHRRVVPWFGLVGCLIGAAVGGAGAALWHIVPPAVVGAGAVAVGLLVTGAFHEDGLADVADAFGGGHDTARRLEILKDSRHGTYGVAALCTSIVIRVGAAGSFSSPLMLFAAFVSAHGLARAGAMATMLVVPAASQRGLGADHQRALARGPTLTGIAATVGVAAVALQGWVVAAVALVVIGAGLVALLAMRKIGGLVGDVLGAVEQVAECLVLVLVSGLALHGRLG
jgi:adenosylcobinamide-GDP ribazoletransferase